MERLKSLENYEPGPVTPLTSYSTFYVFNKKGETKNYTDATAQDVMEYLNSILGEEVAEFPFSISMCNTRWMLLNMIMSLP